MRHSATILKEHPAQIRSCCDSTHDTYCVPGPISSTRVALVNKMQPPTSGAFRAEGKDAGEQGRGSVNRRLLWGNHKGGAHHGPDRRASWRPADVSRVRGFTVRRSCRRWEKPQLLSATSGSRSRPEPEWKGEGLGNEAGEARATKITKGLSALLSSLGFIQRLWETLKERRSLVMLTSDFAVTDMGCTR